MADNDIPFYGLNQEKFEELIMDSGKLVTWRAGFQCSCWDMSSGSPNYECEACGGVGVIYQAPVTVKALMSGIDTKRELLPAGEWRTGDITCTVPNRLRELYPLETPLEGTGIRWVPNPMWEIGEADLVTLPDSEQRASEVLVRGRPMWRRPPDTMLHPAEAVLSITALLVADPVSGAVTYHTQGTEETDYTISGGVVTWLESSTKDFAVVGNKVHFNPNGDNAKDLAEGAQYSVTYRHLTTYIVYQGLPQARDHYGKMPRKVALRLKGADAR